MQHLYTSFYDQIWEGMLNEELLHASQGATEVKINLNLQITVILKNVDNCTL